MLLLEEGIQPKAAAAIKAACIAATDALVGVGNLAITKPV